VAAKSRSRSPVGRKSEICPRVINQNCDSIVHIIYFCPPGIRGGNTIKTLSVRTGAITPLSIALAIRINVSTGVSCAPKNYVYSRLFQLQTTCQLKRVQRFLFFSFLFYNSPRRQARVFQNISVPYGYAAEEPLLYSFLFLFYLATNTSCINVILTVFCPYG
jgi:hypothetical protein